MEVKQPEITWFNIYKNALDTLALDKKLYLFLQ